MADSRAVRHGSSQWWQYALHVTGTGELTTSVVVELWDLNTSPYPERVYRKQMTSVRPNRSVSPLHVLQLALDWAKESG